MKILNAMWFTAMGNPNAIGIVIAETEGKEQAYIGRSRGFRNRMLNETATRQWCWLPCLPRKPYLWHGPC
jgi:hypothetical protein